MAGCTAGGHLAPERLHRQWQAALLASERRATLGVHVLFDAMPVDLQDAEPPDQVTYMRAQQYKHNVCQPGYYQVAYSGTQLDRFITPSYSQQVSPTGKQYSHVGTSTQQDMCKI